MGMGGGVEYKYARQIREAGPLYKKWRGLEQRARNEPKHMLTAMARKDLLDKLAEVTLTPDSVGRLSRELGVGRRDAFRLLRLARAQRLASQHAIADSQATSQEGTATAGLLEAESSGSASMHESRSQMDRPLTEMSDEDALEEYAQIERQMRQIEEYSHAWRLSLGRFRIAFRLGPSRMFLLIVTLYVLLGVAGTIVLTELSWQHAGELGVALIVGSLFGIGAFMSQAWAHVVEWEATAQRALWGYQRERRIAELRERHEELHLRLNSQRADLDVG